MTIMSMAVVLVLVGYAEADTPRGTYSMRGLTALNPGTAGGRVLPLCGTAAKAFLAVAPLVVKYDGSVVVNGDEWDFVAETSLFVQARKPKAGTGVRIEVWFWRDAKKKTAIATLNYAELHGLGVDTCTTARTFVGAYTP